MHPRSRQHLPAAALQWALPRDKVRPTHPFRSSSTKNFAQHGPFSDSSAKNFAQHAIKRRLWAILSKQGELFRAHPHIRPRRANFFAHRAQHSATVKPPSPLLAPEQQPLKPTTPLRPKNAPKTPVSHPQRRWRFQMRLGMGEQRRRRYPTTAWPVCGLRLRHQQVPMCPLLRKLARNSIG